MAAANQVIRVLRRNLIQAIRQKRIREAADLIEQLKSEEPLSLETRGMELEYLITAHQWREAGATAEQLVHLYPQSARIHYLAGRVYYHKKNYQGALHCFRESNALHAHWRTRRWLGKTHTQLGQYTEAEADLIQTLPRQSAINLDLAWLYERMNQPLRALEHIETYLADKSDDEFANAQRIRLRAITLDSDTLSEDVDSLMELGEKVPREIMTAYLQNLLESGQGSRARQFISGCRNEIDNNTAASLAWICHRLQAYDLAMILFLQGLPEKLSEVKYLSALESAAGHCNRIEEVITQYESRAPDEKRLYGRIKMLKKRMGGTA